MVGMPNPAVIPLTGEQHTISAGDYRATVTELGAGLRELWHRDSPLIAGYEPDEVPPAGSGQLLLPWPNRVDHGRYEFRGQRYQLDLSEPARDTAIHGLTRWAGWDAVERAAAAVTLRHMLYGRPGYPFCLELAAEYRLDHAAGLSVTVSARNAGSRPAPYGTGSHPYLTAGTPTVDDCELELRAASWLPTDERGIPAGPPRGVGGTPYDFRARRRLAGISLDYALTGLARDAAGLARALLAGGGRRVELWAGPGYEWLQVFTGDGLDPARRRNALAVEPMTCPPNAFVTGTGLLILDPGASVTHRWGLRVAQP
jgi:aldose 1-epimerase